MLNIKDMWIQDCHKNMLVFHYKLPIEIKHWFDWQVNNMKILHCVTGDFYWTVKEKISIIDATINKDVYIPLEIPNRDHHHDESKDRYCV